MEKPNPECPGCQGKGIEHSEYNWKTESYSEPEIRPCRLCAGYWPDVYQEAKELAERYAGKIARETESEHAQELWAGEDGARYRRLLQWLWSHPPGGSAPWRGFDKKHRSKPLGRLPRFRMAKRRPQLVLMPERTPCLPVFAANVSEFKPGWTEACKGIADRGCTIPVLRYLKVTVELDRIWLDGTDLRKWARAIVPADGYRPGVYIIPAQKVAEILRTCSKTDILAAGLPVDSPLDEDGNPSVLHLANESCVWTLHNLLGPENFPNPRRKDEVDEQVA